MFKAALLIILISSLSVKVCSQSINSSCTAPATVENQYRADASNLALKRIIQINSPYANEIEIPYIHLDSMKRALMAVYNLTGHPARDTVIDMFNIHCWANEKLKNFSIYADSNLAWVQDIKAGNMNTSNDTINDLLTELNAAFLGFNPMAGACQELRFEAEDNSNLPVALDPISNVYGVMGAIPALVMGDGNNITAEVFSGRISLIWSYGWEDCPVGCLSRRYWKFDVYYDCTVQYMGSYGSILDPNPVPDPDPNPDPDPDPNPNPDPNTDPFPISLPGTIDDPTAGLNQSGSSDLLIISPNPFENELTVNGLSSDVSFSILNTAGQIVCSGFTKNNQILELNDLNAGVYFLHLNTSEGSVVERLIKL